ncbi:MAG: hypothetical protein RL093_87 [Pseudomonadota bacterium]|jgi:hypothetical protein
MNTVKVSFAAVLLAALSACQTVSTEQVCRAQAASRGVELDTPAVVQHIPGTEQVIYDWEPVFNGRAGVSCTVQRGHVQKLEIFAWNSRP